jgi:hypothetical protein
MTSAKRHVGLMDLDEAVSDGDEAPGMYRLIAFVERLEQLVLYDAQMTAEDAREITAFGIGEIDVQRQQFRLSPQFTPVIRRKAAN